jgi:23S rRNA (cytosine1962-C5)-methyltransferase
MVYRLPQSMVHLRPFALQSDRMDFLRDIPSPAARRLALHVKPAAERALRAGHPWLFDQAIRRQSHEGQPGDLAVIFDHRRRFLAIGLYDPHSPIRVRILHRSQGTLIDPDWFLAQLTAAARLRALLPVHGTSGYRLVHGENDGLPGLIVDRYDATYVIKLYTAAWLPHLHHFLPVLAAVAPAERLVLRLSRQLQERPEFLYGLADGQILRGPPLAGPVRFQENGLLFEADPVQGQKTGFFLDQRENRARVERSAKGASVLNAFAYSGGFSVYAARGGAVSVTSLDISRPALEAAVRHFELNRKEGRVAGARHELLAGDAFALLAELRQAGRLFDLVIVDPPAFAKSQSEVQGALVAYGRLVHLALGVLRPGGTLVTASCSSRVSAADFFAKVHEVAVAGGRPLREIERTGHPIDHPVSFAEGAYLKCLFALAP